jgi:ubiquinone/menaquinone biosynthesis C-methylase UbiE
MEEKYTHGHEEPVLRSHRWRTAANSAAYLLPHLSPGMALLDIGCGPGTITTELAGLVAPGRVVGVDRADEVLADARSLADAGEATGVEFRTGDVYHLDFEPHAFDIVHSHQMLQHLADPVAGLTEMRRVLRPNGLLAVRDADYGAFVWYPDEHRLDRWRELYTEVSARNGAEANAGRRIAAWVAAAGFGDLQVSSSTWTFADEESRLWWTGSWADRCVASSFAEQALEYGLSTRGELESLAEGWREWGTRPGGVFVVLHVEVLARPAR